MAQQKKGDVSIANVLAIIGLAGLGIITFFGGVLYATDGNLARPIITAIVYVLLITFLLFFAIKAKGAQEHPDKWRYAEWASVILLLAVAVVGSDNFQHFFSVATQKKELQKTALSEVNAVNQMYDSYDRQQKEYLDQAVNQIRSYLASGQINANDRDKALSDYVQQYVSDPDMWASTAARVVSISRPSQIGDFERRIKAWNYLSLASLATEIDAFKVESWENLQQKIENYGTNAGLIPVIEGRAPYTYKGFATFDLGPKPESQFSAKLAGVTGNTVTGWVVLVLLLLLVLLNYAVAPRQHFVGPGHRRDGKDGGASL